MADGGNQVQASGMLLSLALLWFSVLPYPHHVKKHCYLLQVTPGMYVISDKKSSCYRKACCLSPGEATIMKIKGKSSFCVTLGVLL